RRAVGSPRRACGVGSRRLVRRTRSRGDGDAARCRRALGRGLGSRGERHTRSGRSRPRAHRSCWWSCARMTSLGGDFLASGVRTATPLALAALGELVVERAGVINISLEGVILAGAFGALTGATHGGVAGGFVAGIACGVLTAAVFAVFVVGLRADQIITGTAVTLMA